MAIKGVGGCKELGGVSFGSAAKGEWRHKDTQGYTGVYKKSVNASV